MQGIGNSHLAITTASPDAQRWFDQGLSLLHDFWDYEALRAFQEASRKDPKCAMCYWGIYRAASFTSDSNKEMMTEALEHANELAPNASEHEQLYIKAASARQDDRDDDSEAQSDVPIWEEIIHRWPQDVDAKLFLALEEEGGYEGGTHPQKGQIYAESLLRGLLAEHPDSAAAHHYWIHAVEGSDHPEAALTSAERLGELAPASGHMVHMPGHIFYRVGDYERARASFLEGVRVDEAYLAAQKQGVAHNWEYLHNLMYLIAALSEGGRYEEAAHYSRVLADGRKQAGHVMYNNMADRVYPLVPVHLRYGDWDEIVKATADTDGVHPDPNGPNLEAMRAGVHSYAAGMQALNANQTQRAEDASFRLDAALWRQSQTASADEKKDGEHNSNKSDHKADKKLNDKSDMDAKPVMTFLSIASLELRASIAMAKQQWTEAKKLFEDAEAKEKDLGYNEPPRYFRPANEMMGDAYLRAGKWKDAEAAYDRALALRPNSGFALYGIAQAKAGAGDPVGARQAYSKFQQAWSHADTGLPQLKIAAAWLQEHDTTKTGR